MVGWLKLSFLIVTGLLFLSCQEGERKQDGSLAYEAGLSQCDSVSTRLKEHDINLDGAAVSVGQSSDEALLPDKVKPPTASSATLGEVQTMLEQFIETADRLLKLGDTRVVVFSQKATTERRLSRASKYLGQVYAEQDLAGKDAGTTHTASVDYFEFDSRFRRGSQALNVFAKHGLGTESYEANNAQLKKMKPTQLTEIQEHGTRCSTDFFRSKALMDRNKNWNLEAMSRISEPTMQLSGWCWHHANEAKKILQSKQQSPKK